MRGYGNPQATFAVETSMDRLAEEAGIDPAELRLINCNKPGEVTPMRLKITTCPLEACIRTVKEKINWDEKRGKRNGRGVGMASLIHVAGGARVYKSDGHGMIVKVDQNGRVDVLESGTDQGQGSPTVISQMVAEALGFKPEDISITSGIQACVCGMREPMQAVTRLWRAMRSSRHVKMSKGRSWKWLWNTFPRLFVTRLRRKSKKIRISKNPIWIGVSYPARRPWI